jgi:prepilin-type N-terminal cleavage/methylation domain-containing protein
MKNNLNQKNKSKGFTLVELLLVIAIIGILAAVLFVSLGKQRERARMTTFKENMRGLVTAATACHDAGGNIQATMGSAICNPSNDIGNIPEIDDCDGTGLANISVNNSGSDMWELTGTCSKATGQCTATCDVNGCVFENCE